MRHGSITALTAAAATAMVIPLSPWAGQSRGSELPTVQGCNSACQRDLDRARAASADYQDVTVALADGFVPASECGEGQGFHFVNAQRLVDSQVEATQPEVLLYVLDGIGGLKLVGIEHVKIDQDQNLATDEDQPELYGQQFQGPMPGHDPLQVTPVPVHYDLHVWLWSEHPTGIFTPKNPALSCT